MFLFESDRPRLLLAYSDPVYASECGRHFRRLGWEVQMVASGIEARELASEYRPDVVVLEADLLDESGWSTRAKINAEHPELRIVVVVDEMNEASAGQTICRKGGAEALAQVVIGHATMSHAV